MKRFFKILGSILVALILLLVIAFWLVSKEKYQNILAQKGAQYLSEKLKTKVEINRVSFTFFNHFNLKGVYIEDNYKDTLAYIGNIQLRTSELLSNYWNNSKPVIKNITLENVYVNLNRKKDSIWNYDFISSAFQSDTKKASKTIEPKSTTNESAKNPEIDLKNIICKNIRFFMNDGWRGEDMNFTFQKLELSTNEIDLSKKNLNLEAIDIEGADIAVREYDGYKPEDLTPDDTTDWGTAFNPDLYKINLKRFHLLNSKFSYIDGDEIPNPKEFDEKNIVINNLNLDLDNTRIVSDTIFSSITKLTANERCGLVIKELHSDVQLSQVHASLNNLLLKTNYSTIGHHYEMNYKNFHDFNDYINKVNMKANISNTNVSSLDIGYFANILNEYPISINLEGNMDGTVDHLVGKNISLQTRNTSFKGDATVIGLPDIENTYFDITNIILSTSGKDLNALIPQTRTDGVAWDQLSKINYTGSYKGMVDQFYTKGNLNTSLGNALLDLNMDFKPKYASYAGHIETDNFDIGKLIKQTSIGKISMKGKIDGSGFDLENLNAKVDATVSSLEVDSNRYVNLTINGIVANKKFDGIFISQDPSLAVNFNGKLDLSGKQPVYNFNSRFIRFDLKKLGLTKESMIGSGYASLNFTGSTLDNFTGTALLKNITIENKDRNIYLNEVLLESTQVANEKILRLTSSIADAEVKGNFYLSGLPNAIQLYLYHYLPQYIKMPTSMSNQELVYKVELKNIDTIINTFMPDIHGLSGSVISGNLNTNTQLFSLDANILSFGYKEFELKDIVIVGAGDYSEFDINTTCGYFLYKNDVIIPSFQINGIMANDTASLSIITQSMNEVLGDAFIDLKATALNKNLYVNILPSNITIKDDKWQLYGSDDIVLGKKILVSNLIFESGAQKITINTKNSETNDLVLDINEIDLESFSNYLNQTKPSIYGRLSGRIEVDNFTENPLIDATIYSTNEVRIDADTLGLVNAKIKYNTEKNVLTIDKGTQILHGVDKATVDGFVNLSDSTIQLNTVLANTSIAFANRFISDFVKDMTGRASGNVNIRGAINNPRVSGNMIVNDASLKVIYLGTRYSMNDVKLNFDNERINIEDFYLHDERKGNYTALVKGYIQHKNFDDIQLNLNVSSSNLLCLNTIEWDNDLFYGFVPAQMTASAKGYLDDLTLDINAKPLKGSSFHMPISSSGDASTYDYIDFVQIGKDQNAITKKKSSNYFKINMNIEATPDAEVYIILDKNTREEIIAKGNGDISLSLDMGNSMKMFGTYAITEGRYEFNFRGVFPRTFTIDEGSKIVWNGDPLDAKLDVAAIYKVPNQLPLLPLIQGLTDDPSELEEAKKKYDTYISLSLKNALSTPDITFDITQPNNKAISSLAYEKLAQIRNNEIELVSQAGVLLLLGEFKGSTGLGTGSYERGGLATASDVISNALSSSLTNVFSEVTGLKNVSLNLGYKTYSLNENQSNINQFNLGISTKLFKERVVVDFGSNVDVDRNNVTSKGTSTVNIGGDFKAQYLVTDDGRLRVNAFRTTNYNAEGENNIKGGMGLSYKKVFNSISDFFTSKKKKLKVKTTDSLQNTES